MKSYRQPSTRLRLLLSKGHREEHLPRQVQERQPGIATDIMDEYKRQRGWTK